MRVRHANITYGWRREYANITNAFRPCRASPKYVHVHNTCISLIFPSIAECRDDLRRGENVTGPFHAQSDGKTMFKFFSFFFLSFDLGQSVIGISVVHFASKPRKIPSLVLRTDGRKWPRQWRWRRRSETEGKGTTTAITKVHSLQTFIIYKMERFIFPVKSLRSYFPLQRAKRTKRTKERRWLPSVRR